MERRYDYERIGQCNCCGDFGECGMHCVFCNNSNQIVLSYRMSKNGSYNAIGEHNIVCYVDIVQSFTKFLYKVAQMDPSINGNYIDWLIDIQYKLQCVNVCDLTTLEEKCLSLNDLFGNAGIPGINNNTIGVMLFLLATNPGKS